MQSNDAPIERPPPKLARWAQVVRAGEECARRPDSLLDPPLLAARRRNLEEFTWASIANALRQLLPAGSLTAGARDAECVSDSVPPQFRSLLKSWLAQLRSPAAAAYSPSDSRLPAVFAAARQGVLDAFGADDVYASYITGCGDNLVRVVTGRMSPLETLFPGGKMKLADAIYRHSPIARYFNAIAAAVTAAIVDSHAAGKLRVLEIGAGTGGMTSAVLPVLRRAGVDYTFSDLGSFFFERARREFGSVDVRYHLHDIERPPSPGSGVHDTYDIVFASNVLHGTHHLERTLRHCASLTAPGGWLILNEVTRNDPWLTITAGLLEGWQKHTDPWRTEGPLVSAETWQRLLKNCGYTETCALPPTDAHTSLLGQHIIVAHRRQSGAEAPPV